MSAHSTPSAHSTHPYDRLMSLLQLEKSDLWVTVVFSAAIGLLTLAVPVATQSIVNTVAFGNLLQPLVVLSLVVLALLGFSTVLQTMRFYVVELLQRRIFVRISSDSANRLLRARTDELESHHGPELVNRFLEVVTLQKAGATLLVDGLSVVMQTFVGTVLLAVYHPWLLAFDLLLLAAITVIVFPLGRGAVRTAVEESRSKYELVAWLEEIARHPTAFRAREPMWFALGRADKLVAEYLHNRGLHFRILLRQVIGSWALYAIASASLLGVGGWLVISRQLTLGQLIAAELVLALVVSGFSKLGKHLETYYDLLAAMDKLGYLTDLPLEQSGSEKPYAVNGPARLAVTAVEWRGILRDANLSLSPGECVAMMGVSGAGKSSLFDIICRYREPEAGAVRLNGQDVRVAQIAEFREQVALVRGVEIFQGTILDNVRMGRAECDSVRVREALECAGLLQELEALPEGLNTELTTGGRPLSGGQAIRLMLARAFAGHPRLLLIDETLDGLDDAAGRDQALRTVFDSAKGWTLLVATNRPDIAARCGRVVQVVKGSVVESEGGQ
ncbi:MAG: ATP-binding cassette domain-containing protein [Acidobacteria bacterium]|nr:ATP-binding cassette domain-containing protein [Acidobacteriota bacterium]